MEAQVKLDLALKRKAMIEEKAKMLEEQADEKKEKVRACACVCVRATGTRLVLFRWFRERQ